METKKRLQMWPPAVDTMAKFPVAEIKSTRNLMAAGTDLFKKSQGEVIDYMTRFKSFTVDGEADGLGLKGIQKSIHHAAHDHIFSAGTHGINGIGKSFIEINVQLIVLRCEGVDHDAISGECATSLEFSQKSICCDGGCLNSSGDKTVSIFIWQIERKGQERVWKALSWLSIACEFSGRHGDLDLVGSVSGGAHGCAMVGAPGHENTK